MILDTIQTPWKRINQATVSQSVGGVDTHHLEYGSTFIATAAPWTAQNPNQWPTAAQGSVDLGGNHEVNGIAVMWLLADTDNDEFTGILWGRNSGGPAIDLLRVTLLAGTSICSIDPDTGAALTNFRYVDTVTVDSDHCFSEKVGTDGADGIIELHLDLMGKSSIFFSSDSDAGSGTAGTDLITYYKYL